MVAIATKQWAIWFGMDRVDVLTASMTSEVSPLVASVSRRLMELVRSAPISVGKGLPSERQLALNLEVSRGVVRAAIKNLVAEGLLEAKANCRPVVKSEPIQIHRRKHLNIWLWPNSSDYSGSSILKGIQNASLDPEIKLVVGSAPAGDWNSIYDSERRFLESLADDAGESSAILWYLGGPRNLSALQKLRAAQVPLVFVDREPPAGFEGDFVGTDNLWASELAVKHLIDLGHRRIALITNMDCASSVGEREAGYRKALTSAGIALEAKWIFRDSVDEQEGIREAIDQLMSQPVAPTAIFCINDVLALQTHEELLRRGYRIPQEISVVGFDGLLRWVPGGGYLTTIAQDFERIGQRAAELLEERMLGAPPSVCRHYYLDAQLMVRASTGPVSILGADF